MKPGGNDSDPEVNDELEDRLNRLWKDRESLPSEAGSGHQLGPFEIQRAVGAGAFGVVYLAKHVETNVLAALKIPRTEVLAEKSKLVRFIAEASVISDLNHPNIVRFLASDTGGLTPWLATEWCDGPDLGRWIMEHADQLPDWKEAALLIAEVADAVEHVHQKGIAHRDLKPANIMLCRVEGKESSSLGAFTPKVADFGLSKLNDGELFNTQSSVILGTPFYMAPEQMDGLGIISSGTKKDMNSDIYSLGAILFELLTLSPPVQGKNYFEVMANAKQRQKIRISKKQNKAPAILDRICRICLRQNPDARYKSPGDLAADLRSCVAGNSIIGRRYSAIKRYSYWHRLQRWKQIAGAFTLFYCFIIGLWFSVTTCGFFVFNELPLADSRRMIPQAISLIVTSIMIPGLIGWCCWKGQLWAAWVGLMLNLPKAFLYGAGMLGWNLMFKKYYEHYSPYLGFTVNLFFFICMATQVALYLFAIRSKRKN